MDVFITSDANSESGVGEVIDEICGATGKHFATRAYGLGLHGLAVILMCRNPDLNFKRRLRFSKKDKMLYMDIMLDFEQMRQAVHEVRKKMIAERVANEVPIILNKYSIPDFDVARFVEDLKTWLKEI
jgi:hypothetical protein